MPVYTPDAPRADRAVTPDRAPLLRAWRSTSPSAARLVEQIALFWLDDDRHELQRIVPHARRWPVEFSDDESVD